MTKQEAISKIKSKPSTYLNDDQKTVAIGIINSIPEGEDVLKYFDFIMKRSDVGFKFDVAPEIATGRIAVVNEMENLNINISEKIDVNENKLIIGDNYEALKNLLLTHKEKIDVIYIDPPYNTEKSKEDGNSSSKEGEHSKFVYKDKFGRNGWLNMMRERLVLARRLLTNEGVIFVSIDDTEQAYLKVLMDEIFGEDTDTIIWKKVIPGLAGGGIMKTTKTFRKDHEYIHVAFRNKTTSKFLKYLDFPKSQHEYKNLDNDPRGKWMSGGISQNINMKINKQSKKYYTITSPSGMKITRIWRVEKKEMLELIADKRIYFGPKGNNVPRRKIFINETRLHTPSSLFEGLSSTGEANHALTNIIGAHNFKTTKPTELICRLLEISSKKNSLILDFFAGSGTTGHSVMQLNKKDNGNRKFILVTNNENDIGIDITYNRLHRIIKGQTIEGKKDFNWIKNNDPYNNASLRVFNIKHFDVEINQIRNLDIITKFAIKNLHKLNPLYKIQSNDIRVYYDLDGLNPLNEAQKKQLYSTDKIIHEKSTKKLTFEKNYCTCGKSFNENDELIQHIKKLNN